MCILTSYSVLSEIEQERVLKIASIYLNFNELPWIFQQDSFQVTITSHKYVIVAREKEQRNFEWVL